MNTPALIAIYSPGYKPSTCLPRPYTTAAKHGPIKTTLKEYRKTCKLIARAISEWHKAKKAIIIHTLYVAYFKKVWTEYPAAYDLPETVKVLNIDAAMEPATKPNRDDGCTCLFWPLVQLSRT